MHELSRMDDETGDPLPGDRRLAPIPVGFTVRSGGTQWLFENSVRTTNPEELWKSLIPQHYYKIFFLST